MTRKPTPPPHVIYLFDKGFSYCSLLSAFSVLKHRAGPAQISFFTATPVPGMAEAAQLLQDAFPTSVITLRVESDLDFKFDTGNGLPAATYGRLILPRLVQGRVLYLDGDTLVRRDVLPLFEMDMDGKCFASALDSFVERDLHYLRVWWSNKLKDYLKPMFNNPDLIDSTHYYNAGVMVMDLDQINATPSLQRMFDPESAARFVAKYTFPFCDQDWINHTAAGQFKTLDPMWNSIKGNYKTARPPLSRKRRRAYAPSRRDPAIVHYAGPKKPWLPRNGSLSFLEKRWYAEYQDAMTDMATTLGQDLRESLL